ncbi:MAG: 2-oxo acid dehydrogenase subunit E2, partial [Eubacteriales bacterium]|nr:2-oxo acid dehydrogenase subunit E2 [Eubacteriales bacterium]
TCVQRDEKRCAMFGKRSDGYLVKGIDPVVALTPYIMPMRCDAQVMLKLRLPYEPLARYVAEKRLEGHQITFMEIVLAGYVRAISQLPELNRFIANKRYYSRKEITVSFAVLQDMADGSDKENIAKCKFDPTDTIFDVAGRIQEAIEETRKELATNSTLKIATILQKPIFAVPVVLLARFLDRYGLMPKFLVEASPFHTGLFFSNNASVGLPPVFHHIYNFGTTSLFVIIGNIERELGLDADGKVVRKRMLPMGVTADERVCAGITYSRFLDYFQRCLADPHVLEQPPEQVLFDEGHSYRLPPAKKLLQRLRKKVDKN